MLLVLLGFFVLQLLTDGNSYVVAEHVAFMARSIWPIRAAVAQVPYPTRAISDIPRPAK